MARRVVSLCFVFMLCCCLVLPAFAYDVVQTDADNFGFAWDDHNIIFTQNRLAGNQISVTSGAISASKLYFYIPVPKPMLSLDFIFTLCKGTGNLTFDSADWGTIYNNSYHIQSSLDRPTTSWLGSSSVDGSDARNISYKVSFVTFPFSDSNSYRFIRLSFDLDPGTVIYTYLSKELNQGLSGVLGNPTYSFDGTFGNSVSTFSSGSLKIAGAYISGRIIHKAYNGSSLSNQTINLATSSPGTSSSYLYMPQQTITSDASSPMKISNGGGSISGSLTPSSTSTQTDLQGTYVNRTYIDTVVMSAVRSYSDQDAIAAIEAASELNHSDLSNISDQFQEIIDHQQGLEDQGQQINSTTSQTNINNTSSTVNSGTSAVGGLASTYASDIQSANDQYGGYMRFLGDCLDAIFDRASFLSIFWGGAIFIIPIILWLYRHASDSGGDE